MNKEVGFYCPVINNTELNQQIIQLLNTLSNKYNTILFNSEYNKIDQDFRKFSVLHCNQAKYFYGILVMFDASSVVIANSFPAPFKKLFVASEIFWHNKSQPATVLDYIVSEDIDIITYNKSIYDLYDICFRSPIANMNNGLVSEEFNNVIDSLFSIK